ncbi:MAG: homoserine O-succinyltransferase [Bacteroidaceae bacterium]|nr:homoserine O-succinyltransferase [Bacteroidaceae bacterium]
MLFLPHSLAQASHIEEYLPHEGIVVSYKQGRWRDVSGLKILLLNLMPEKQVTERDIVRMLRGAGVDIVLVPLKISGQTYKTTPQQHMETYYADFEQVEQQNWDGLIVTGAPLEHLPFEQVRYWPQLCHIMDWATSHVVSTLYICWAAQAALYHHHGIAKHALSDKQFGIYDYRLTASHPLLTDFEPQLSMPTSRHTEVRLAEVQLHDALHILCQSEEAGVGIAVEDRGRTVYVTGHLEYARERLDFEYHRDVAKGRAIAPPRHYYTDATQRDIRFAWRDDALRFYHNWINHLIKPHTMDIEKTNQQFETAMQACRDIFVKKLHDYGAAWRILRPESVTDQIYIKANRIRGIQVKGHAEVDEDISGDFQAIVNYSIVGLIQLELGYGEHSDITAEEATQRYDHHAAEALQLMKRKNHDYDEAWRAMRISSYTDLILMKVFRTKQIEELRGKTLVSEGISANYQDMLNYSIFALIKLSEA